MNRGGIGPSKANIVIVGEAYGRDEERYGRPFVGGAGRELTSWLKMAGLDPSAIHYTNVINKRPPGNDFKKFCLSKKEAQAEYGRWRSVLEMQRGGEWASHYCWKQVASGAYLHPKHLHELYDLQDEVLSREPNLVILCGNTACWALLGTTGISKLRGAVAESVIGIKALPVLHPAAILRDYEKRPLSIVDMMKAAQEAETAEISRPAREVWIDPSLEDLARFHTYLTNATYIGCDIETEPAQGLVKVVGFSADEGRAIVVPFLDPRSTDGSYWPTPEHEAEAWSYIKSWLQLPQAKIFQNGVYDITWLWVKHGLTPSAWEDTLLQAHALQPELPKDLGTLGSIYTNEPAWKLGHSANKEEA